jgi:beta-galactosidase
MKNLLLFLFFLISLQNFGQRSIQTLNSAWEFSLEENEKTEIVNIPHTWNSEDVFSDGREYFRGKGTYKKQIFAPEAWQNKLVFLKFEGSNQITTVFVNNEKVGEHHGGYTGFVFDISKALHIAKENEIRIEVNNSHTLDIPPLMADFNFYGGIYRDLYLIVTDEVHFELVNEAAGNILVRTPEVSDENAKIRIETKVVNHSSKTKTAVVHIDIINPGSQNIHTLSKSVRLKAGETKAVDFEQQIKTPELWSPDFPNLYEVEARITEGNSGTILDDFQTKIGLRWFEVSTEKGMYLNGKPLKLIGANRHQDYEGLGNALPNALHRKDYKMIKDMGSNFIRTAHYPQDPEVYRLCDELGLIVWSEIPVINDVTDSDAYHDISLQMQREQIKQHFNHPSVFFWGYMNEIIIYLVFSPDVTQDEREAKIRTTVELAEKLERETKKMDPDRLSVMALHEDDLYNSSGLSEIPDVIGWNLYFGWYSQGLEGFGEYLDKEHRQFPNRPLIISEYGPGADVRLQTDDPQPWDYTESYQLKLHRSYINQVMERDFVIGMSAWNFADFGSSIRQDSRPYINQKGLVNFDRSKKDIYYYYQAKLLDEPFIYIAGEHYEKRFPKDEHGNIKVSVFSNAEQVNLKVNDSDFNAEVFDGIAEFDITLPEGKHQLTATAGEVSYSRELQVKYRKNLLSEIGINPLQINVGTHVNFTDETTDEIWISDQQYSQGGFGYVGGEVYQKNPAKIQGTDSEIKGTENDPLFQTMREGLNAYRFDVEKGNYRVTLLLTEPNSDASEENIYNLSLEEQKEVEGLRRFGININGKTVTSGLNLARDYGRNRAVEISYKIKTGNGIEVKFEENSGKAVLSGIKLEKL